MAKIYQKIPPVEFFDSDRRIKLKNEESIFSYFMISDHETTVDLDQLFVWIRTKSSGKVYYLRYNETIKGKSHSFSEFFFSYPADVMMFKMVWNNNVVVVL